MPPGRPTSIDIQVSRRVRKYRRAAGLSLSALARVLGVSAHQMKRYDDGRNRISPGRLSAIARALGVPVTALYSGEPQKPQRAANRTNAFQPLLKDPVAQRLLAAFLQLDDLHMRRHILGMVERMAVRIAGYKVPGRPGYRSRRWRHLEKTRASGSNKAGARARRQR